MGFYCVNLYMNGIMVDELQELLAFTACGAAGSGLHGAVEGTPGVQRRPYTHDYSHWRRMMSFGPEM